jgi:alkylation response protein AidB-like acyl-CoA dehydrogenase
MGSAGASRVSNGRVAGATGPGRRTGDRDADRHHGRGQKVWTSGAQYCSLGLATVRTNPDPRDPLIA